VAPRLPYLRFAGPDKGTGRRNLTQSLGVFTGGPAVYSEGYVRVTSTAISSKPASERSPSYSPFSSAPETHPNYSSTLRATPGGNSPRSASEYLTQAISTSSAACSLDNRCPLLPQVRSSPARRTCLVLSALELHPRPLLTSRNPDPSIDQRKSMYRGQPGAFGAVARLQTPNPSELETRAPHQNPEHVSINLYHRFILDLTSTFMLQADSHSSVQNVLQISLF
jgi:hypothetical protein